MHIERITFQYRNDFHFVAGCRHCGKPSSHRDGYADDFYRQTVLPCRCCDHCGLNEHGETQEQLEARFAAQFAAERQEAA